MKTETLNSVKQALENANLDSLFTESIGTCPEDMEDYDATTGYALMFNVENDEVFFLSYATPENSWAKTAEQQNTWIHLGYVSAIDIIMGSAPNYIIDKLEYEMEQTRLMDEERRLYNEG